MQTLTAELSSERTVTLADADQTATLLLHCPDRRGLVGTVADFILQNGGNILQLDQHVERDLGLFFLRVEWSLMDFELTENEIRESFSTIANDNGFHWKVAFGEKRLSVAVFVSRYQHCLVDLLHRHEMGELNCRIAAVFSNHPDARPLAEYYGLPFHHIPVTKETKAATERMQLDLLARYEVELVVLARYMQVLSPRFVSRFPNKIINVHHSFLPAFVGAKPYHAAYERGVKLIGATSHYVTNVLDEGAIIEQEVTRVSHRDRPELLVEKGRDLERVVLSRAVRWHLENRILCYGNKTVVFE
jgi:formyltetrahydrofolate deformylase